MELDAEFIRAVYGFAYCFAICACDLTGPV